MFPGAHSRFVVDLEIPRLLLASYYLCLLFPAEYVKVKESCDIGRDAMGPTVTP